MRQQLIVFFFLFFSVSVQAQHAEMKFEKSLHKFPKTNEGKVLKQYYVFSNTGNAPLIISSYAVGCHCTKVTFPSKPIAPGMKDSIYVEFDTKGKYYHQDRSVILTTNAKKKESVVRFKVYVIPKED